MADLHDLSHYVRKHPDDRVQRWRLAKKLYMAGDFDDALVHLKVLRKQWPSKLNIARYLSATQYRLGDFNGAIAELEKSLKTWPEEIPIRQQLARVLEGCGQTGAAIRAWEKILEMQPNHPFAREAMQQLVSVPVSATLPLPKHDRPLNASMQAMDVGGRKCPQCGADNGDEFERCWQCHASLEPAQRSAPRPAAVKRTVDRDYAGLTIAAALVAVVGTGLAVFLGIDGWTGRPAGTESSQGAMTVRGLLASELLGLRLAIAAALFVGSPIALIIAMMVTRAPRPPMGTVLAFGWAVAAIAVSMTWLPLTMLSYVPVAIGILTLVSAAALFMPKFLHVGAIWLLHAGAMAGLVSFTANKVAGETFMDELPAIVKFGIEHDAQSRPGENLLPQSALPATYIFRCATTGSPWLDARAAAVRIEVYTDQPSEPMDVELFAYEESLLYDYDDPVTMNFDAELGRPYRIVLSGKTLEARGQGAVFSVLPITIDVQGQPAIAGGDSVQTSDDVQVPIANDANLEP